MENQGDAKQKRKEGRSPGYPAIDLETAIERARQINEKEQRHFAPLEAVAKHWGYSTSKSGPFLGILSALIKFGLLETKGVKEYRQVKISDLAWGILIDNREESPEKARALKEAALNPFIHKQLWSRYEGDLPSDETLRIHLLRDYKFTEGAVKDFIGQFKRTIIFANLEKADTLPRQEEDKSPPLEDMMSDFFGPSKPAEQKSALPTPRVESPELPAQEFKLALSEGQFAYIKVPHSLKPSDWKKIEGLLEILKPSDLDS